MDLTELQKIIINAPEDKIAVSACAAALKTSTLIEKTRKLLQSGIDPKQIAVITFTRLASQELKERLGNDYKDGIFIGTIHALAAHFLTINGLGGNIKKAADEEDFDKLFRLCETLCLEKFFDWVLVDEMQDCGKSQLEFIFNLLEPDHFFCAFDYNQSIYGFNGARPDLLKQYLQKEGATIYSLNENYRNGRQILAYAKKIFNEYNGEMFDNSIPKCNFNGMVIKEKYKKQNLIDQINKYDSYKDWAILCRTNLQVNKITHDLDEAGIPNVTFKQGDLNKEQLEKLLNSNSVKVITAHSSKGLAWNNVAIYGLWNSKNAEEIRLKYVAATRARKILIVY